MSMDKNPVKLVLKILSGNESSLLLGWHIMSDGENIGLPDHVCMEKKDGKWIEQGLQESLIWELLKSDKDKDKFNRAIDTMLQRRAKASEGYITICSES